MQSTLYQSTQNQLLHEEQILFSVREFYNNQKEFCNYDNSTDRMFKELERLRILWSEQADKVANLHTELVALGKDEDVRTCDNLNNQNIAYKTEINELRKKLNKSNTDQLERNELLHTLKSVFTKISNYVKIVNTIPTDLEIVQNEASPKASKKDAAPVITEFVKPVIDLFPSQFYALETLENLKTK